MIDGATNQGHTLVPVDGGTSITFSVIPVALTGASPGLEVESERVIVLAQHTINANAELNGSISPVSVTVNAGEIAEFTLTPASDYVIDTVNGCSGTLSGTRYFTGTIVADCTVNATFRLKLPPIAALYTNDDNTLTHILADGSSIAVLSHALEVQDDRIGNENGLCESNETCLYMPNIGSYQGHGILVSAGTFVNGTSLTDITLLKYQINGR